MVNASVLYHAREQKTPGFKSQLGLPTLLHVTLICGHLEGRFGDEVWFKAVAEDDQYV